MPSQKLLKELMIPEPAIATEGLASELLPTFIASGVLMAPIAIGAGIAAIKRAFARKSNANRGTKKPKEKAREDVRPYIEQLMRDHPNEVKAEMDNRIKFIKNLDSIITKVERKHNKVSGFSFADGHTAIKLLLSHYTDAVDAYDNFMLGSDLSVTREFLTDLLPCYHPADSDPAYNAWGYSSGYCLPLFTYDIWTWVDDHPQCNNARDFDQTKEYWDEQNAIVNDFFNLLKTSEFFYSIECGGDWDDGSMDICFKPSEKLLAIATKELRYRPWPKSPKK